MENEATLDVKTAVGTVIQYANDLLGAERLVGLALEEVEMT